DFAKTGVKRKRISRGVSGCRRTRNRETTAVCQKRPTRSSAQPARGNVGPARLFLDVGDVLLRLFDLARHPLQLGQRLEPVVGKLRTLIGIVPVDDIRRQAIDLALESRGE